MYVKFADLRVDDEHAIEEVVNVMRSGQFINGPQNKRFQELFGNLYNVKEVIPTASGSAALTTALNAIEAKGKVLIPTYSFAATLFSVLNSGHTPVFVPINSHGCIAVEEVLDTVKKNRGTDIVAILPVHLYGQIVDLEQLKELSIAIIEDACQAYGSFTELQGDAACFSFYPSKNLGAMGDAGAIITDNDVISEYMRAYVNYGDYHGNKYEHDIIPADNLRMDELQAVYLNHLLSNEIAIQDYRIRKFIALRYEEEGIKTFILPDSSYHLYPILVQNRYDFIEYMKQNNIEVGNHYPYTLPGLVNSYSKDDRAKHLARHVVTLPNHPRMSVESINYVIETVTDVLELVDHESYVFRR